MGAVSLYLFSHCRVHVVTPMASASYLTMLSCLLLQSSWLGSGPHAPACADRSLKSMASISYSYYSY